MWNCLPIQTSEMKGNEYSSIDRGFEYQRSDHVVVRPWKDVQRNIKNWAQTIWKHEFGSVRSSLNDKDLLGWIPDIGTIAAHYGRWIGTTRSKHVVYIDCLYVSPIHRGEGVAKDLIMSICNECQIRWGKGLSFFFEVDEIPKSLKHKGAVPLCRYSYAWVPFLNSNSQPVWKQIPKTKTLSSLKGFHGGAGLRLYQNASGDKMLFDSNNDIVWYTNILSLYTFDGFKALGAYCRIFSSIGSSAVFAENMYFTPSYTEHYVLC